MGFSKLPNRCGTPFPLISVRAGHLIHLVTFICIFRYVRGMIALLLNIPCPPTPADKLQTPKYANKAILGLPSESTLETSVFGVLESSHWRCPWSSLTNIFSSLQPGIGSRWESGSEMSSQSTQPPWFRYTI